MTTTIIQSILIFIVLMLAFLLKFLPKGRKYQNLPLCGFLVIVGIHILIDLTIEQPLLGSPKIHLIPSTFIFLYGPLLYLHIARVAQIPIKHQYYHWGLFITSLVYYIFRGFDKAVFFPIYALQLTFYLFLITKLINRGKRFLKPIKVSWSFFITYSFGLIWLFAFTANICGYAGQESLADTIENISFVFAILFFTGLLFFTMAHPDIFMEVRLATSNQLIKVTSLNLEAQQRMEKLQALFEQEKLYQNPDLNRELLAQELSIDPQQFSKEVNQYFKQSLPDLMNRYRITEAQVLLDTTDLTVKEVYYEVGFNSRSAFNTAFKKATNLTPSEYKLQKKVF